MVRTNCSGCVANAAIISAAPFTFVPSGRAPDASMGTPESLVRHSPIASKFSIAKPTGSITLWHPEQAGLERCSTMRSRTVPLAISLKAGTLGGGGGGGVPRILVNIHLPRSTGEVRLAYD